VLQVLIIGVVLALFFGLVVGQRGGTLILLVALPSLIGPSIIWLRARRTGQGR
jgi:hypothetical protein